MGNGEDEQGQIAGSESNSQEHERALVAEVLISCYDSMSSQEACGGSGRKRRKIRNEKSPEKAPLSAANSNSRNYPPLEPSLPPPPVLPKLASKRKIA